LQSNRSLLLSIATRWLLVLLVLNLATNAPRIFAEDKEAEEDNYENNENTSEDTKKEAEKKEEKKKENDDAKTSEKPDEEKKDEDKPAGNTISGEEAAKAALPQLTYHTEQTISVYKGDLLVLEIEAQGEGIKYRWLRENKTLCREAVCEVDTAMLGSGKHSIVAVVYNRFGSSSVRFLLKVLQRPNNEPQVTVKPPSVKAENIEFIKFDDLYVKGLIGIGYSYLASKVSVVGPLSVRLDWQEKLKSHSKGILKFGRPKTEEHYLMPNSVVALVKSNSGRRAMRLIQGTLRSRQIKEEKASFSTLVSDWLQIDPDLKADYIITRDDPNDESTVVLTVLRGNVRVFQYKTLGNQPEGDMLVFPALSRVEFKKSNPVGIATRPRSKEVTKVFPFTSSQYIQKGILKKPIKTKGGSFLSSNLKIKMKASIEEASKAARAALDENDPIVALENLLPVAKLGKKNTDYLQLMGITYYRLGLFDLASVYFAMVVKAKESWADPYYMQALIALENEKWADAEKLFGDADDRNYSNWQAMHYYMGVAQINQGENLSARNSFKYSLWGATSVELEVSTRNFLRKIADDRNYGAIGSLGIGMDNNIYNWSDDLEFPTESLGGKSGNFYDAYGKLYYNGFSSDLGYFQIGYDIRKRGYTDSKLVAAETMVQHIYADWLLRIGDEGAPKATVEFGMMPYIKIIHIGEERAADIFAIKASVGSPKVVANPTLMVDYQSFSDPLPTRDDILDPVKFEPVTAADRSGTYTKYGLQLTPADRGNLKFNFYAGAFGFTHDDSQVKGDDFSGFHVKPDIDFRVTYRFFVSIDALYESRTFPNYTDGRKDTVINAVPSFGYSFNPAFGNRIYYDYKTQTSSAEGYSHKRGIMAYEISLEL